MRKTKELATQMSPCDTDIYDKNIRTPEDAKTNGKNPCPRYDQCQGKGVACTMRFGVDVARYVLEGSTLDKEIEEVSHPSLMSRTFINSLVNGGTIIRIA